ncbi:phage head-tail adapter protein, partial [Streptococcus pyogenes]
MTKSEGPSYRYKKPEAQNGDLRTPLSFYTSKVEEGVDGRDMSYEKVVYTMGQI